MPAHAQPPLGRVHGQVKEVLRDHVELLGRRDLRRRHFAQSRLGAAAAPTPHLLPHDHRPADGHRQSTHPSHETPSRDPLRPGRFHPFPRCGADHRLGRRRAPPRAAQRLRHDRENGRCRQQPQGVGSPTRAGRQRRRGAPDQDRAHQQQQRHRRHNQQRRPRPLLRPSMPSVCPPRRHPAGHHRAHPACHQSDSSVDQDLRQQDAKEEEGLAVRPQVAEQEREPLRRQNVRRRLGGDLRQDERPPLRLQQQRRGGGCQPAHQPRNPVHPQRPAGHLSGSLPPLSDSSTLPLARPVAPPWFCQISGLANLDGSVRSQGSGTSWARCSPDRGSYAACISSMSDHQRVRKSRRCSPSGMRAPCRRRMRKYCRSSSNAEHNRAADAKLPNPRMG